MRFGSRRGKHNIDMPTAKEAKKSPRFHFSVVGRMTIPLHISSVSRTAFVCLFYSKEVCLKKYTRFSDTRRRSSYSHDDKMTKNSYSR